MTMAMMLMLPFSTILVSLNEAAAKADAVHSDTTDDLRDL
jgi:hypothetical protein